jgi:predicted RNA-binding Zn-ribbon protein involved in translation (DUF1610 family)
VAQLRVHKISGEHPQVTCPSCGEMIAPELNPIMDSYDCPECGRAIDTADMARYAKAVSDWDDQLGGDGPLGFLR